MVDAEHGVARHALHQAGPNLDEGEGGWEEGGDAGNDYVTGNDYVNHVTFHENACMCRDRACTKARPVRK